MRAVALSRKRGFSKNVLRDRLAAEEIDYRHFRELGTPKAGREAARAGDAAACGGSICDEVLTTPAAGEALDALAGLAATGRSASSASSATRRGAIAASLPSGWRSTAFP